MLTKFTAEGSRVKLVTVNRDGMTWDCQVPVGSVGTIVGVCRDDFGCSEDDPSFYVCFDGTDYTDLFFREELERYTDPAQAQLTLV